MAYIVGIDRYQSQMVTTSLDEMISEDNSVRVIDAVSYTHLDVYKRQVYDSAMTIMNGYREGKAILHF